MKDDAITKYAKRIKDLPTVMRMEIDFVPERGWMVTIMDQRWSLQRGIAAPTLHQALKETYEDLK